VPQQAIASDVANTACSAELTKTEHDSRMNYQMGRALLAKHDSKGARGKFELALSDGYRAARIDLGNLLKDDTAGIPDPARAVALYEKAWNDDVTIAAFNLGRLYELGAASGTTGAPSKLQPDMIRAWSWYQKGADAGEPNALARLAERDETSAFTESDSRKRNALLLQSFRYYAAAAERAKNEDWPYDTWRHWRYRRATLARLLAREGMMQQVADAYASVRKY
jgi:TPR repeat protein